MHIRVQIVTDRDCVRKMGGGGAARVEAAGKIRVEEPKPIHAHTAPGVSDVRHLGQAVIGPNNIHSR